MKPIIVSFYLSVAVIVTPVFILVLWRCLHCWFRHIKRRCRRCGAKTKRFHKIRLASDESISMRSPDQDHKVRWWIRRVLKFTISECPECDFTEAVKLSNEPISVWHAWWTKFFHQDQFEDNPAFDTILALKLMNVARDFGLQSLKESDNPPLNIDPLSSVMGRFVNWFYAKFLRNKKPVKPDTDSTP